VVQMGRTWVDSATEVHIMRKPEYVLSKL
jgi:hypothetical protein